MPDILLTYQGTVKDGVITLPKRLRKEVVGTFEGKHIEVTFRRKRKRRSSEQNRYYWGVVIPEIVRGLIDLGNEGLQEGSEESKNTAHELLKQELLKNGEEVFTKDGTLFRLPSSTTKCTTVEFEEYLERVRQWAAEYLGIVIPLPNEQTQLFVS